MRCECLEVVGIPSSVGDTTLEKKICQVFLGIGVEVGEKDMQSCHRLKKNKSQTIVKLSNRSDSLEILRRKKQLPDIEPALLDLPLNTNFFINESLCPYSRSIWNKCKKLRESHLIHQYYTISGTVLVSSNSFLVRFSFPKNCLLHLRAWYLHLLISEINNDMPLELSLCSAE